MVSQLTLAIKKKQIIHKFSFQDQNIKQPGGKNYKPLKHGNLNAKISLFCINI